MFVLCTLAVLTLHDLLRCWSHRKVETSGGASGSLGKKSHKVCRRGGGGRGRGDGSRRPGQMMRSGAGQTAAVGLLHARAGH
ncbi:hypothetical protein KUCAC02_020476 [Chaenocephalus aceratus]|nr:hypothetical protein KUCAC02_020476 [Chaenocephalus aceratus]